MLFFMTVDYRMVRKKKASYRRERRGDMNAVERMKQYLKEEFGIENAEQLEAALRKMKPIDIGVFVSKPRKVEEAK